MSYDTTSPGEPVPPAAPAPSARDRIIEATLELAAERDWNDFGIAEIATRARVSLSEFRDAFPSKGAVLGGLSRRIDRVVLDGTTGDLASESPKERLFDVLMRRLDALAPYKLGLDSVREWVRGDALAAAALNGVELNAMRFMCVAAGVDVEGRAGSVKLQGLVFAWLRVLDSWFDDVDPGLAKTMAVLDRELDRGERLVKRVEDVDRLATPLRLLGRALMDSRRRLRERRRDDGRDPADEAGAIDPAI